MKRISTFLLAAGLALVLAGGCGGGSSSSNGGATGQLQVGLTDQSGTYRSVVLAITEVRVVQTGQGNASTSGLPVIATFNPPRVVDVLALQFQQQLLGSTLVPAGSYEQLRLVLAANVQGQTPVNFATLNSDPNTKLPLTAPSGQESGLKIPGSFTVQAGVLNAIVLDFNPDKAIVSAGQSGQLLFKPTGVRIVQTSASLATFGALAGSVQPSTSWPSAVVAIVPQGGSTAIASGTVNPEDGSFRALVPAGTYSIQVTASGFQTFNSALKQPPQFFTVTSGQDTAAGTITLSQ